MASALLSTAIATTVTNPNVLSGNLLQFLQENCLVEFFMAQSATGLDVSITVGREAIAQAIAPNIRAAIDASADKVADAAGLKGDQIIIRATNPTGGTLTLFTLVRTRPVG